MTFPVILIAIPAIAIAIVTTRRAARYSAGGMTAGMAAMMAAMGTGLSAGYAAGMLWDLGWANLIGVLAGGLHGLWMGRRSGPMAALDGAGGGVMGGLMGPMLAVMLLYLPLSLTLTALLMVGLQAAFSAGAVYLVASAAGAAPRSGWLHLLGRVLGAASDPYPAAQDHYAVLGVPADAGSTAIAEAFLTVARRSAKDPERLGAAREALAVLSDPLRRARYDAARLEALSCCPPEMPEVSAGGADRPVRPDRSRRKQSAAADKAGRPAAARSRFGYEQKVVAVGVVIGAIVIFFRWGPLSQPSVSASPAAPVAAQASSSATNAARGAGQGTASGTAPATDGRTSRGAIESGPFLPDPGPGAPATVKDGVQEVALSLRYPRYEPAITEVKSGQPVRLTIQAIGDPG